MSAEVVPLDRRWRSEIPQSHKHSLDTRLQWLWMQRFGTLQTIYLKSTDLLDRTAATLLIQAIIAKDLRSIEQLFQRLEGGSSFDHDMVDQDQGSLRI